MKRSAAALLITGIFVFMSFTAQPTVGVLAFTPKGASKPDAEAVRELVISELVKTGRLNILDRENIKFIVAEQAFQQSGSTDQEYAVNVGKLLDAQFMVYGSLMKLGTDYIVAVNLVSVETSEVLNSSEKQFRNISEARKAVQTAIYGIAMMKRKTGEQWTLMKKATFATGVVAAIGAITTGIIGYSKYNTVKGIKNEIPGITDPTEQQNREIESRQVETSADIITTVAVVAGVTSLSMFILSRLLPNDPMYEDIPWNRPLKEPETKAIPEADTPEQPATASEEKPPLQAAPPETVVVVKEIVKPQDPAHPPAVAEQPPLPRMFVQRIDDQVNASAAPVTRGMVPAEETPFIEVSQPQQSNPPQPPNPAVTTPADSSPARNRSGIRLQGATLWGDPRFFIDDVEYRPGDAAGMDFSSGPLVRLNVTFLIKAGPDMSFEIGPTGQWQSMNADFRGNSAGIPGKMQLTNGLLAVSPGIFFIRRNVPLKINAGIFADVGWSWMSSSFDPDDTVTTYASGYQETNWANAFGWGAGVRAGAEYLMNEHFGANADFMFRFGRSGFTPNETTTWFSNTLVIEDTHIKKLLGYSGFDHPVFDVIPPMFGFSLGLNLYY